MSRKNTRAASLKKIRKLVLGKVWTNATGLVDGMVMKGLAPRYEDVLEYVLFDFTGAYFSILLCLDKTILGNAVGNMAEMISLARRCSKNAGLPHVDIRPVNVKQGSAILLRMPRRTWKFIYLGDAILIRLASSDSPGTPGVADTRIEYILPFLDSLMPDIEDRVRQVMKGATQRAMVRRIELVSENPDGE